MKIVFCGGGTAGHITPNIALIEKLQTEECYYVGSDGMEKQMTQKLLKQGKLKKFCEISASKLERKLTLKNLALPFLLIKSVSQARKHLKEIKPNVVFSKGGYVGLPVVIAARTLGIPSIVHESDISLGLANKISSRFAHETLTTYPTSKKYKAMGAIIREEILHGDKSLGLKTMKFDGKKPILLVMGGSLGAKPLNDAISQNRVLSEKFDIFVICGKGKKLQCDFVHQAEFVGNVQDVFAATTVCLTRGGSNALAELTLAKVPFVAVPLEKCSRGEQIKNATWYAKQGCGMRITETNLSAKLPVAVQTVFEHRQNMIQKQSAHRDLYGTDNVVGCILKYQTANENRRPTAQKQST